MRELKRMRRRSVPTIAELTIAELELADAMGFLSVQFQVRHFYVYVTARLHVIRQHRYCSCARTGQMSSL